MRSHMGDAGSAYQRFQRALATGNLQLIRAAAAELPRVDLGDALAVCMAIRAAEPQRFERAALAGPLCGREGDERRGCAYRERGIRDDAAAAG